MSVVRIAIAILMLLVGSVWVAQGIGVLRGSAMTGQAFWAVIGVLLIAGAAGVAFTARRSARG